MPTPLYRRHRFPGAIISHCVWLYHRFHLNLRDIVEMLAKDGVTVSHETIRRWCRKCGQVFAEGLRRHRAQPADRWHLAEMQLKMKRTTHYLWRAVDRNGLVLGVLVHARRNAQAALAFLNYILERVGRAPRVIVTDKLRSYGAALKHLLPRVEHRQHKGLNNRAENAHQPTRRRERSMQRFTSPQQAQVFLEPFGVIGHHVRPGRHLLTADRYRAVMVERFQAWGDVTGTPVRALS